MQGEEILTARISMHMSVIRTRRAKLNRHLILLTLANILIWLAWRMLSDASGAPLQIRLAPGLCVLTSLTWLWLAITLHRRFLLWHVHERRRGASF